MLTNQKNPKTLKQLYSMNHGYDATNCVFFADRDFYRAAVFSTHCLIWLVSMFSYFVSYTPL